MIDGTYERLPKSKGVGWGIITASPLPHKHWHCRDCSTSGVPTPDVAWSASTLARVEKAGDSYPHWFCNVPRDRQR